ncbi:MAG: molybdopterin-dependent oxidoreductase, partial [Chloroflexota bacterium]|nr:molybdopterin-dependent oxidoreductase [Chloroflexota bacterium]
MVAALAMVAVQLAWRVLDSENNVVQAFPEFIAAAISRLTPISWFGTVTETYGNVAKRSLLVTCVIGVVIVGIGAGRLALALTREQSPNFGRRLVSGLVVAAGLLAVALLVILPIANLGVWARESSYTGDILTQLIITFALWGVLWAVLSAEPEVQPAAAGARVSRRTALQSVGWSVLGIGATIAIFTSLVDMFRGKKLTDAEVAAQEQSVDEIVATQRPIQATPEATTSAPTPETVFAQFDQLEANGDLTPVLTATKDFYHVSKNFTDPTVSSEGWTLEIGGLVANPKSYTYDELVGLATTKNITTLCCISNELNGDLISTAEWTGVPLVDLLTAAGVAANAVDLKFTAADDYTESIPVAVGQNPNVLLVVGMNGEPLPDDHGFPARLIVPPIYGMKNVKWITKIEAVDHDYQGYWQERGWSDPAPYQIWGRIDYPRGWIEAPGPTMSYGVASAGDRDVQRVEVSIDDGATWADAQLEPALNAPFTWVRWAFPFEAVSGKFTMKIRVTDGQGAVM